MTRGNGWTLQGPLIGQNGHKSPVLTTFLEEAAEVRQRAQSSVVTRAVVPVFSQFFSQDTAPPQQQLHVLTSYLSSSKTTTASYEQTILKRRRLEDAEQQHKQARSAFVSLGKKLESAAQSLINKRKNQNATDPQEKLQKLTDLRNMATASIRLTAMGNEIWKDQVRLQMKRERLNWETDHSKVWAVTALRNLVFCSCVFLTTAVRVWNNLDLTIMKYSKQLWLKRQSVANVFAGFEVPEQLSSEQAFWIDQNVVKSQVPSHYHKLRQKRSTCCFRRSGTSKSWPPLQNIFGKLSTMNFDYWTNHLKTYLYWLHCYSQKIFVYLGIYPAVNLAGFASTRE